MRSIIILISTLSILSYFTVFSTAQEEQEISDIPNYAPAQFAAISIYTYITEEGITERREKLHLDEDGYPPNIFSNMRKFDLEIIDNMSHEQFLLLGLDNLTFIQRALLNKLINSHINNLLIEAFKSNRKYQEEDEHQTHHVLKSFEQGGFVILEDETIWRVHSMCPFSPTNPWYSTQNFTITKVEYSTLYLFRNKENGAVALAKYIGYL